MNRKALFGLSLAAFIGISVVSFSLNSTKKETYAYSGRSASELPTTIDLNDSSDSDIRNYYSALSSKSTSERQGNNLLKNLKEILKNGQIYYSYDTSSCPIWRIYEISDRDWEKSPASEISGYNSTTNKITGYSYGTSYSNPGTNPFLHALYVNREDENLMRAWKKDDDTYNRNNHGNNAEWYIDKEHIWVKSQGFEDSDSNSKAGARGDPMHLWPGDSDVNSSLHSNYFYGYVGQTSGQGAKWDYARDNKMGTSLNFQTSNNIFEPQDCDKGDIARAIFYMAARYNYFSGEDDGIGNENPNLMLTQDPSDWVSSGFVSSTSKPGKVGILTDLLNWHHQDPVDEFEIHRNNLLFNNYTNNRNPFIDFPEWADFIWGTATYNGRNYVSYSSTPTGYATPSTDTINGYNSGGEEEISVTGVSLNKDSTSITVGDSETLTATVTPSNATDKSVTWNSSNTNVATVSDGVVTAVAEGSTTITVTTNDGGFTDTCSVTVSSSDINYGDGELLFGSASGRNRISDTSVNFDDNLENNWTITTTGTTSFTQNASYSQLGSASKPASTITFTTTLSENMKISNFTASFGGFSGSAGSITLKVDDTTVATGSINASNDVTVTQTGSVNGKVLTIAITGISKGIKAYSLGYKCEKIVVIPTLTGITLDTTNVKTEFEVGDTFTYEGLVVTANYDNQDPQVVTPTSVSSPDMSTEGNKEVTVTYTENNVTKTATYEITVSSVTPPTPVDTGGTTVNLVMSEQGYSNGQVVTNISFYSNNNQTIEATPAKGTHKSSSPAYYDNGQALRFYIGNTLTITSSKQNIIAVHFKFKDITAYPGPFSANVGTYTQSSTEGGNWTGLTDSIVFSTSGAIRVLEMSVTYYDATSYANDFLDETSVCDASGKTNKITSDIWSSVKSKYNDRLFTEDQNTLKGATGDEKGTVVEHAMKRYDIIATKYYRTDNFIDRTLLFANTAIIIFNSNNNSLLLFVTISSTLILVAFIYLRKKQDGRRKEN